MSSLGIELPKEQARVRALMAKYRALPDNAGYLAAALMEQSLKKADTAIASGDVVAMIRSYEDLKAYEG